MYVDEIVTNDDHSHETYVPQSINNISTTKKRKQCNRIYFNKNPERNTLRLPLKNWEIPVNTRYDETTKNGRKIVILSDSITKPININKLNDLVINVTAVKLLLMTQLLLMRGQIISLKKGGKV